MTESPVRRAASDVEARRVTVHEPKFKAPLLLIDDFLPEEDAEACLAEAIELRRLYFPAHVGQGPDNRRDEKIRRNDAAMLDSLFAPDRSKSDIMRLVGKQIASRECNHLFHEACGGHTILDVVNYADHREHVLSRYGRCHFYGWHKDTKYDKSQPGAIKNRLVTLVYYMNTRPEQFSGGRLSLIEKGIEYTITPQHNRAVIFPSFVTHRVENVELEDDAPFSAGRFSLNHWIGFKA